MNLTEEQKQAIEAKGHVIVSASAGSGKTFVMIERLVSLILNGEDIRSVLAVTFTDKAAAQMRDRLRVALLERSATASEEQRHRIKEQLKALPLAQVSTIHAFCARLIRANFFLAGVDNGFRIISPNDAEGRVLRNRALDEVFEQGYEDKDEDFLSLLAVYYRKKKDAPLRGHVLTLYKAVRGLSDYREQLQKTGKESLFEDAVSCVYGSYSRQAGAILLRAEALRKEYDETSRAFLVADAIVSTCEGIRQAGDLYKAIEVASAAEIPRMPKMTQAEGEELLSLLRLSAASERTRKLCAKLKKFPPREKEEALCRDAEKRAGALAALTLRFDEAYSRLKKEGNVLDYDDLEHLALTVLENEEARRDIASKYRHIFVDEYQDVNPVQDKLVSLLAGDNVFFVGDSKQAIYAFRGSNSDFFDKKTKTLPQSLALSENFRSAVAILELANRVFLPHIPNYIPMRGGRRYGEYRGETIFHRVIEEETKEETRGVYSVTKRREQREDALAERIAMTVEEETEKEIFDADKGIMRKVEFGDIAILTRNNDGIPERVVRALEERDIPVTTTSRVNVCNFFEARLLIDALSYLDNPEQDIPLASFLLSAAGGCSEEDLARIRLDCPAYDFRTSCKLRAEQEDELGERLRTFFSFCDAVRSYALVHTAAETINFLLASGLEAQIASGRDGELRLSRVRRLLAEAEDCPGIHAFLARLKATDFCVDYAGGAAEGAVKVLTMHGSKGLEYPVVMLAGLDLAFHGADRDEALWTERFRLAPHSFDVENKYVFDNILRKASAVVQEEEELVGERNLLYVAMTRARCRLHLFLGKKEEPAYIPKRFADFLEPFAEEREEEDIVPPLARTVPPIEVDKDLEKKVLAAYRASYPFEDREELPVKSSATDLLRHAEDDYVRSDEAHGDFTTEKGTAYHLFLQHVTFGRDAGEELARMRQESLLTEEQLALLDEGELRAILALPCLQLRGKLYREQRFLLSLPACELFPTTSKDDVIFQGAIDLLVEEGGKYRIVDYKYSSRTDESLKEHYGVQISLYKKAVAKTKGVREEDVGASIVNIALLREIAM